MAEKTQDRSEATQYWNRMAERGRQAREAETQPERTTERAVSQETTPVRRTAARRFRDELER